MMNDVLILKFLTVNDECDLQREVQNSSAALTLQTPCFFPIFVSSMSVSEG